LHALRYNWFLVLPTSNDLGVFFALQYRQNYVILKLAKKVKDKPWAVKSSYYVDRPWKLWKLHLQSIWSTGNCRKVGMFVLRWERRNTTHTICCWRAGITVRMTSSISS